MTPVDFKIKHIAMVYYPQAVDYNVYTDRGIVTIQQISDAGSPYNGMFYEPTWGIADINLKTVVGLSLAWDEDYANHCRQQLVDPAINKDEFEYPF